MHSALCVYMDFLERSRQKNPSLPSADSLVNTFTKCLVHKDLQHSEGLGPVGSCHFCQREEIWALSVKADWTVIDTLETVTRSTKMANHNDAPHSLEIWQVFAN